MVRVNLLPDKRGQRALGADEPGQIVFAVSLAASLVVAVVVCIVVQNLKDSELTRINQANQRTQGQIDAVKQQISDHQSIKDRLKELRDREDAITKLQAARTGPTQTLLELARLFTPGRGPTTDPPDLVEILKRDHPTDAPNPAWDPHRVWISSYIENDRAVQLAATGRDGDDISEIVKRFKVSKYFSEVKLLAGNKETADKFRFSMTAKVKY